MDLEFLKWLWGLLVPYSIYLHKKIDRVSEDTVKRDEHRDDVESIRKAIHDGNQAITGRIDQLMSILVEKLHK